MTKVILTLNLADLAGIATQNFQLQDTTNPALELRQLATMFDAYCSKSKLNSAGGQTLSVGIDTKSATITNTNVFTAVTAGLAGNSLSLDFDGSTNITDTIAAQAAGAIVFTGSNYDLPSHVSYLGGAKETVFTAVANGVAGNSIALVFDGNTDVSTVVAAWNASHATKVGFTGNDYLMEAQTVTLVGGGVAAKATKTIETKASATYTTTTVVTAALPTANTIALVFNGTTDTIASVVAAWNEANPTMLVGMVADFSEVVPSARTVTLTGGSVKTYSLT